MGDMRAVDLKSLVLDTPLEPLARRLYIRLDPSPGSQQDRLTVAVIRRCLRTDSNCVDIGAYRGTILAEIVRRAPVGHHHAVEPISRHNRYLAKAFPTVRVHAVALSNARGEATFLHNRSHPTRSHLAGDEEASPADEAMTVQTDTLDNILPASQRIDLIKVDVEGAELEVMEGGARTLRAHRPVVVFEHTRPMALRFAASSEAMHDFLTKECGMQIFLLKAWLSREGPLSRAAFVREAEERRNQNFMAHPSDPPARG
jgi:FkbM family methyltransferase